MTAAEIKRFERLVEDFLAPRFSGWRMVWAVLQAHRSGMSENEICDALSEAERRRTSATFRSARPGRRPAKYA